VGVSEHGRSMFRFFVQCDYLPKKRNVTDRLRGGWPAPF
jgi:hypothetical protein